MTAEASAVEAVKRTTVPILIIHGDDDRFVPCQMSQEIYDACSSDKTLVIIPKAGHGISYIIDRPKYEKSVKDFLKKVI